MSVQAPPALTPPLLADRAYTALRDRIVNLTIAPGEPIDEDRVSRELEIGRTPVREAIRRLALERLVVVYPRRGTFAAEINITDLAHISDLRVVVEAHAARRAAQRLTDAERGELERLVVELRAAGDGAAAARLIDLDARVHRFVYRAADNPHLADTCDRCFNLSLRIWHLALDRVAGLAAHVGEHVEVLESIAAGDPERAAEALAAHVRAFERGMREVL